MNRFFLILFFSLNSFCQEFSDCLLQNDNKEYVLKLEATKNFGDKLVLIANKINRDAIYKVDSINIKKRGYFDNSYLNENGNPCGKKILHFVYYKKGNIELQIDPFLFKDSETIFNFLSNENIIRILYLDDKKSSSLYGTNGNNGVVIIYSNDRKIKKLILEFKKKIK